MTEIRRWLDALGLGEYAGVFEENAVDLRALPMLSEDDLKELGLKLGHRRVLQHALSELPADPGRPTSEAAYDAATSPSGGAERRQLTVMFCDLVGSTALSHAVDPEDYRELLSAYQDAARAAIAPYEGYTARYMGDGLLVYFGYPQAHEDDAERAVRAGLDIATAVGELEVGPHADRTERRTLSTGTARRSRARSGR